MTTDLFTVMKLALACASSPPQSVAFVALLIAPLSLSIISLKAAEVD